MKKISMMIFFFSTTNFIAQNKLQAELDLGYAFQKEIKIDNQIIEDTRAFGVRFGLNNLIHLNDKIYIETGLFGKLNKGKRKIETVHFTYESLRGQVPVYIGYLLHDNWYINLGASVENNKDFDKFDINNDHNVRYDLLTKLIYNYKTKVQFSFYTHWMTSSSPDILTISSPRNGLYLGVIYTLKSKSNLINESQ